MYNNDDLYGVTIGEYCDIHSMSVDDLIASVSLDIEILNKRLEEIGNVMIPLFDAVYWLREKKIKHRDRLIDWSNGI